MSSRRASTTAEKTRLAFRYGSRPPIYYPNGDVYTGEWCNDKKQGIPTAAVRWPPHSYAGNGVYFEAKTGNEYRGEYFEDMREGRGVLRVPSGSYIAPPVSTTTQRLETSPQIGESRRASAVRPVDETSIERRVQYEGSWKNDRYHGEGLLQLPEGRYKGQFQNGLRHGTGTMEYLDGQVYEGHWQLDEKHGDGKLVLANGDVYQGRFDRNRKHGAGKFLYTSKKRVYTGEWIDDVARYGSMVDIDEQKLPTLEVASVESILQQAKAAITF